jgi:hypothetical protein
MAFWKNRFLLAATEVTYNTLPTIGGVNALLATEIDVTPLEVDLKDRELIRGTYGNTLKVVGGRMAKATVTVELAGSGTAGTAPRWGALMRACGFSQTIVAVTSVAYAPVSTGHDSVSLSFFADGTRHNLTGCRGTVSFSYEVGEVPTMTFEFTGLYNTAAAESNPTPTFGAQAVPLAFNSVNTTSTSVHGFAGCLSSLSLDIANVVTHRQLAGCTQNVQITDRLPSGSFSVEAPALGSKDYFAAANSQTLAAVNVTHGGTAGNIAALACPSCNLGTPAYSDKDGIIHIDAPFMPNPVSGNDEVTLTLT